MYTRINGDGYRLDWLYYRVSHRPDLGSDSGGQQAGQQLQSQSLCGLSIGYAALAADRRKTRNRVLAEKGLVLVQVA